MWYSKLSLDLIVFAEKGIPLNVSQEYLCKEDMLWDNYRINLC